MIVHFKIFSFARPEEHFPHKQKCHVHKQKSQEPSREVHRRKRVHTLISQPLFKWRIKRVMISRAWPPLLVVLRLTRPIFLLLLPHLLVVLIFSALLFCFPPHLFLLGSVSLFRIFVESAETGIVGILLLRVTVKGVFTPVLVTEGGFCVTLLLTMLPILLRETCKVLILLSVWILGLWILVGGLAVTVCVCIATNLIVLLTFVRVRQHIVSTRNFLELIFSLAPVLIRVILLGKLVVLLFYVCFGHSRF